MRAVRINPFSKTVSLLEGTVDELWEEEVQPPQGWVPLADGVGLIHCPTGAIGSKACLFWYRTLADFFGGICFVIAVDSRGNTVQLPADTYDRTLRAVEFLGAADDAVPRLQHLISGQMRFVAEEPSQMSLKLH